MLVVSRFVFLIPEDFLKEIKVFLLKKKKQKQKNLISDLEAMVEVVTQFYYLKRMMLTI